MKTTTTPTIALLLLSLLLFSFKPSLPVSAHTISTFLVEEQATLQELDRNGYRYVAENSDSPTIPMWIYTDAPIAFNGQRMLHDGKMLRSLGTRLTVLSDKELEAQAESAFDAEWKRQQTLKHKNQ